jgi:uncharacterized protein YjbI with pentapeptide repeats
VFVPAAIVMLMGERKSKPTPKQKQSSQDQASQSKPWTLKEFSGKTVWDWLQLLSALAIPVVLAVAGLYIESQLDARQRQFEKNRAQEAQDIENQRAAAERELAEQRAQDEALQAYLNQMDTLLLEKDLLTANQDSVVVTLARARTLTVLERLDPSRKAAVMQFLVEAELVFRGMAQLDPVIELHGANLGETDLRSANLSGAILSEADLSGADLSNTILDATVLYKADLSGADLGGALLSETDLSGADLSNANLSEATGWTAAQLEQAASLEGATMPDGQKYEDWLKDKKGQGKDVKNE